MKFRHAGATALADEPDLGSGDLPIVLCVDDEAQVLEALETTLRKVARVVTAPGGAAALDLIRSGVAPAVIISDMRMPGMNGAEFLAEARRLAPDATRVLLTGHTDVDAAVAVVNDGQIFRFLTKPCPVGSLVAAVQAAADLHRLVTAEQVLLEQTLTGSVKALMEVLALSDPAGFGRATRVKALARELATRSHVYEVWSIEVAAQLTQVGCVTLPAEVNDKLARGARLTTDEQSMIAGLPATALHLIADIPRLDDVRGMLERWAGDPATLPRALPTDATALGGEILRLAFDYEVLDARGIGSTLALQTIDHRGARYDPRLVKVLKDIKQSYVDDPSRWGIESETSIDHLEVGMQIAADVTLPNGVLLVGRGFQVTHGLLARIANLRSSGSPLPTKVTVVRRA